MSFPPVQLRLTLSAQRFPAPASGAGHLFVKWVLPGDADVRAWLDALDVREHGLRWPGFVWRMPDGALEVGLGVADRISAGTLAALAEKLGEEDRGHRFVDEQGQDIERQPWMGGCSGLPGVGVASCWEGFGAGQWILPVWRLRVAAGEPAHVTQAFALREGEWKAMDPALTGPPSFPGPSPALRDGESREAFEKRVREAADAMARGGMRKVVLARSRVVQRDSLPLGALLLGLGARYPRCTLFAFAPGDGSVFAGVTPEVLLRANGGQVETMALAGSAPRGATATEDARLGAALTADDKERHEHALVVQQVRTVVRAHGVELEGPDAPTLLRLHNVQHLHTPFRGALREPADALGLAAALHPTPAVCGDPRDLALAWLREREGPSRGWYAGPFGAVVGRDRLDLVVALRTALLRGDRASLQAGAGIVVGSDPAREYDETNAKMDALRGLLLQDRPPGSPHSEESVR